MLALLTLHRRKKFQASFLQNDILEKFLVCQQNTTDPIDCFTTLEDISYPISFKESDSVNFSLSCFNIELILSYLANSKHVNIIGNKTSRNCTQSAPALWIQRIQTVSCVLCMLSIWCIAHRFIDCHLWYILCLVNYFPHSKNMLTNSSE